MQQDNGTMKMQASPAPPIFVDLQLEKIAADPDSTLLERQLASFALFLKAKGARKANER